MGLGIKFLKHIERCKTLLHLVDVTEQNLVTSYKQVRNELGKYSKNLLKKDELPEDPETLNWTGICNNPNAPNSGYRKCEKDLSAPCEEEEEEE